VAGSRQFVAGPGAVLLTDMAQQSQHRSTASQSALFTLPRATAEALLGPIDRIHGMVLRSDVAAMLVSHLQKLRVMLNTASVSQGAILGKVVVDLLTYSVSAARESIVVAPAGRDSATLMRACDIIEARLGSPSLDIADLCRRLGISRSALYRLFEGQGGIQNYIRSRRLERVKMILADPDNGARIGDLAELWGFSDAAHLSRLFRAQYDISPRDFREAEATKRA
jgi:AraC-like DNA-binding protein